MEMLTGKWSKDQLASRGFQKGFIGDTQPRGSGGAKIAATVLTAVLGLGAGWIAGKSLGGAISYSAPESSVSVEADPASTRPLQDESQPPAKGSQPQPDPTRPVVKPEPPLEAEKEQTEIPDYEQSTKEIGRQALKKMMKEIKRMNRNERQDKHRDGNENSQ